MPRTVTIHQPNYLPWIGLFSKIKLTDCLIFYDSAQYVKNSIINRNKIRTSNGFNYLTIPVGHQDSSSRICDVALPKEKQWQQKHWRMIHDNYTKAEFFGLYHSFFKECYLSDFQFLWQFNEQIILYLLDCFGIKVEIIHASDMKIEPGLHKTDLMIALLKGAGADVYLSGPSGINYLETEKFIQSKIQLKFFKFEHPVYPQRYPGFEPNLSAIDLLFNIGPAARNIIKSSGSMVGSLSPTEILT